MILKGLGDLLHTLFIPDSDSLDSALNRLSSAFTASTGVSVIDFGSVFGAEKSYMDSVKGSVNIYGIGTVTSVFADFSWVGQGVQRFRPYIRGMFVLGLAFYNLNQFLGFIGAGGVSMSSEARKMAQKGGES